MMVNKTKREDPNFQFRGFGGVQCQSLFFNKFSNVLSLSLLFSLPANEEAEEELLRAPRETRRFRRRRRLSEDFEELKSNIMKNL